MFQNVKNFFKLSPLGLSFFIFAILLVLVGLGFYQYKNFNYPPIRSDGEGYYSYLPAFFLEGDLTFNKTMEGYYSDGKCCPSVFYQPTTGNYLQKYPIGVAILMIPFFILGHGTSVVMDQELNGYTSYYQIFASLSGAIYGLLGLLFLWHLLSKYFSQKVVLATSICILFATNLYHYFTYDSIFSHAYSFFLFAAFLYWTESYYQKQFWWKALVLGFLGGLIILVRQTNLIFLVFLVLYGVTTFDSLQARWLFFWKQRRDIIIFTVTTTALVSMQLGMWLLATGRPLAFSYEGEYFNWLQPNFLDVLFSVRKGLFFWTPILLFTIPGFYFLYKKIPVFFWPSVIYLFLQTYIISAWWAWYYGGSFGHRGYTESLVIFALALASFFSTIKKSWLQRFLIIFCGVLICVNLVQMYDYWRWTIPFDDTTWEFYKGYIKSRLDKLKF